MKEKDGYWNHQKKVNLSEQNEKTRKDFKTKGKNHKNSMKASESLLKCYFCIGKMTMDKMVADPKRGRGNASRNTKKVRIWWGANIGIERMEETSHK